MLIVKWESVVLEIIEAAKILDCVKHIHLWLHQKEGCHIYSHL